MKNQGLELDNIQYPWTFIIRLACDLTSLLSIFSAASSSLDMLESFQVSRSVSGVLSTALASAGTMGGEDNLEGKWVIGSLLLSCSLRISKI